jgi:hypothetical protein
LSGADLHGADLHEADLHGADLHGANLHGADLYGADLHGADLHGANLSGANLHAANLHGVDLSGANLYAANLHGVDLSGGNLDFSVLIFSCNSFFVKFDTKHIIQILYHAAKPCENYKINLDADTKKLLNSKLFKKVVNKFHRVKECETFNGCKE